MYVTANGARLFVDIDGEGLTPRGEKMVEKPTVIMVHGGPGADHTVSKPFFSQLTDIAQVVYYDHRGNGRSEMCDPSTWTLATWGDDLKALCDTLGIERPIVIGTSFGGFVALSYATRYPDHAGGLVLISTAAKVDFAQVYDAFGRIGGDDAEAIARSYWEHPTDEGRALYRDTCVPLYTVTDGPTDWMSRILWRNETALHFNGPGNEHGRMDFRDDLPKITTPTLIMVGDRDPITPPAFSDVLNTRIAATDKTCLKFENCGHGVVQDKPDEALAAIRSFVSRLGPDPDA